MESCQPIKRLKDNDDDDNNNNNNNNNNKKKKKKKMKKKKRCENNPTFLRGTQKVRPVSKQTKLRRRRTICYRSENI